MRKLILIVLAILAGGSVFFSGGPAGAQTDTTDGGNQSATTTTAGGDVGVSGVIENGDEPVEGVTITVKDASGEVVGEASTNADGEYDIPLPGPGDYSATLDVDSLPSGVDLRNPDRATLEQVQARLEAVGAEIGEIQNLGGDTWSLFFRDVDGMELEVCAPAT